MAVVTFVLGLLAGAAVGCILRPHVRAWRELNSSRTWSEYRAKIDARRAVKKRSCRVCGCTDDDCSGCVERTGLACWWVTNDLCSACEPLRAAAMRAVSGKGKVKP